MIPDEDKVGVTVVLVTCSYRSREFVRVGYARCSYSCRRRRGLLTLHR